MKYRKGQKFIRAPDVNSKRRFISLRLREETVYRISGFHLRQDEHSDPVGDGILGIPTQGLGWELATETFTELRDASLESHLTVSTKILDTGRWL